MSTAYASRRFGTDVSNIPSDALHKTPKKSTIIKSTPVKSKPASVASVPQSSNRSCFDGLESLMDTLASEISIDDEITVKSPVSKSALTSVDYFRYERDFLLAFQETCKEPISGLIPEVIPGFAHPEPESMNLSSTSSSKTGRSNLNIALPNKFNINDTFSTPGGGVIFKKPISPRSKAPSVMEVPPVGSSDRATGSADLSAVPSIMISLEWRAKKAKKQKPREQDARRLAARQKQIDIGMNTVGYKRFTDEVPNEARTKAHPKIPDINQVCSKRSWDGQVRKWRRQLHDYDPQDAAGQTDDGQNAAERHVLGSSSEEEYFSENDNEEDEEYEEEEGVVA